MTLAGIYRPCEKKLGRYYDTALIIGGSIFIALSAQVAVWLPFSPVPVTAQTFAVLMAGLLLGSKRGSLCILTYLLQGAAGLPVFAMGRSGLVTLLGPTGGYLFGFLAAACIVGLLAEKGWDRRFGTTILAMAVGNIFIYGLGLLWLCRFTGGRAALITGLYPFIAGEVLKMLLAAAVLPASWKILEKFRKNV
jgi:biotin transport system substrate-specific component